MSTKSLSTYKSELETITKRHGFSGVTTNYLISMLSYAIYEDQYNIMVANNELNPEKATDFNDVIDFAMSRMYKVYRGMNPLITVKLTAALDRDINRFDLLWAGKGFQVYSLQDYLDIKKDDTLFINCIVAKSLESVEAKEDDMDEYFIDFGLKNVSETFILEATESVTFEEVGTTTSIQQLVDNAIPMQMTSYDYGIRFYFKDPKAERNMLTYKLTYFPYYDSDISENDLKGFNINGFDIIEKNITAHTQRDDITSGIGEKAKMNLNAMGVIRSNDDLLAVFNQMFQDKVKDSSFLLTDGSGTNPDEDSPSGNLLIYYVPKDPNNLISNDELASYYEAMTPYIPCKSTVMDDGTVVEDAIKPLKVVVASGIPFQIVVNLHLSASIDTQPVYDLLYGYEGKINIKLSVYNIIAAINALSPYISYNKSVIYDVNLLQSVVDPNDAIVEEIELEKSQYLSWTNVTVNVQKES